AQMHRAIRRWQVEGLWAGLMRLKGIFVEPADSQQCLDMVEEYTRAIQGAPKTPGQTGKRRRSVGPNMSGAGGSGAVFFGVFRGRLSEGLSLGDELVRCVIVIGIPYPSATDIRITLKKVALNRNPLTSVSAKLDGGT